MAASSAFGSDVRMSLGAVPQPARIYQTDGTLGETKQMGLSVNVLLQRYFYVDEVKAALSDIGESSSGNKPQLVNRLVASWQAHNRNFYELFDYLDTQTLRVISEDYGLDHHGDRSTLLRRIRRADLLVINKKTNAESEADSDSKQSQSPLPPAKTGVQLTEESPSVSSGLSEIRRLRFRWPLLVSIVLTALIYFVLPLLGLTAVLYHIGAATVCFIGLWSGLRYLSERT